MVDEALRAALARAEEAERTVAFLEQAMRDHQRAYEDLDVKEREAASLVVSLQAQIEHLTTRLAFDPDEFMDGVKRWEQHYEALDRARKAEERGDWFADLIGRVLKLMATRKDFGNEHFWRGYLDEIRESYRANLVHLQGCVANAERKAALACGALKPFEDAINAREERVAQAAERGFTVSNDDLDTAEIPLGHLRAARTARRAIVVSTEQGHGGAR